MNEMQDGRLRLSSIWGRTRTIAGVSQEYMASEMGVARKTIQNWEKGVSVPDLEQTFRWFRVLGISPLTYLWEYLYPNTRGIKGADDNEKLRESLIMIAKEIPEDGMRQLLFLLYGNHGSSPRAVMNLLTAHLQTPMKDRVIQADIIVKNYELARRMDTIACPGNVQPDIDLIQKAIKEGEEAAIHSYHGYLVGDE